MTHQDVAVPATASQESIAATAREFGGWCDCCGGPATEENMVGRCWAYGIETFAHCVGCEAPRP